MIQWLRLHASTLGDRGSIPGQETKIPHALQCSQQFFKKNFFLKSPDRVGLFLGSLLQRSPVPGPQSSTDSKSVRNKTTQQQESSKRVNKASPAAPHSSRYRLNHIPPHSTEKTFSLKLIPGVRNVRHHCSILFHWLICLSLCQYHTVLIARDSI